LTDRGRVSVYTQSAAEVSATNGAPFSLFNNSITGTNEEVVPGQKIVQRWRFQDWQADHYSHVTIKLESISSGTRLSLIHKGIPSDDFDRTRAGWRTHFWYVGLI
jgi:activator of HSP90 ATPase